jgi:hypothetical protein
MSLPNRSRPDLTSPEGTEQARRVLAVGRPAPTAFLTLGPIDDQGVRQGVPGRSVISRKAESHEEPQGDAVRLIDLRIPLGPPGPLLHEESLGFIDPILGLESPHLGDAVPATIGHGEQPYGDMPLAGLRSGLEPDQNLTRRARPYNRPSAPMKKPRLSGAFVEADEGTRTLDLLHGKQTL